MLEQFIPPFRPTSTSGTRPVLRGVAMLCWIDESTKAAIEGSSSSSRADGWLLWIEDRGVGLHLFGLGPTQYVKYKARRTWDLELRRRVGSTVYTYPAGNIREELEVLDDMRKHHVGGWLQPDWSVGEVTHGGTIQEFALFEAMLPRLAASSAALWSRISPYQRASIEQERLGAVWFAGTGVPGTPWNYDPRRVS
jgi:hypothetical protein